MYWPCRDKLCATRWRVVNVGVANTKENRVLTVTTRKHYVNQVAWGRRLGGDELKSITTSGGRWGAGRRVWLELGALRQLLLKWKRGCRALDGSDVCTHTPYTTISSVLDGFR